MAKKKKLYDVVVEEIEVAETIEATIEEVKPCDWKCEVQITDQFVKFEGIVYRKYDKLFVCKELAQKAKRCKVL